MQHQAAHAASGPRSRKGPCNASLLAGLSVTTCAPHISATRTSASRWTAKLSRTRPRAHPRAVRRPVALEQVLLKVVLVAREDLGAAVGRRERPHVPHAQRVVLRAAHAPRAVSSGPTSSAVTHGSIRPVRGLCSPGRGPAALQSSAQHPCCMLCTMRKVLRQQSTGAQGAPGRLHTPPAERAERVAKSVAARRAPWRSTAGACRPGTRAGR